MPSLQQNELIVAFGFDQLGKKTKDSEIEGSGFTIHHVAYDSEESIATADGVMIPSDIFENSTNHYSPVTGQYTLYHCDTKGIAEREKQLFRILEKGGWVCFFLRRLRNGQSEKERLGDLVRKIVNLTFMWTKPHDPYPHVKSKSDEFRKFFEEYGIAQTELGGPRRSDGFRELATSLDGNDTYAAEIGGRKFFLPLKPLSRDGELEAILKCAANSILAYKKRNDLYLPKWVNDIQFDGERKLIKETERLTQELERARTELLKWPRYKAVLTASGRTLNEVVVSVLREYFQLNLKSEEAYVEDAMIYAADGAPLYVVEIKGVASGIKREQINQLDSHRERLGLDHQVAGLLIINDFSETAGIDARKGKQVDSQHLEHAQRLNVRILRTTALIELMVSTEHCVDRATVFLHECSQATPLVRISPATKPS